MTDRAGQALTQAGEPCRGNPALAPFSSFLLTTAGHHDVAPDESGRRAAILYTLIETARLNDVDPKAWLADVIARIADYPINRVEQLLPWNWSPIPAQAKAA